MEPHSFQSLPKHRAMTLKCDLLCPENNHTVWYYFFPLTWPIEDETEPQNRKSASWKGPLEITWSRLLPLQSRMITTTESGQLCLCPSQPWWRICGSSGWPVPVLPCSPGEKILAVSSLSKRSSSPEESSRNVRTMGYRVWLLGMALCRPRSWTPQSLRIPSAQGILWFCDLLHDPRSSHHQFKEA